MPESTGEKQKDTRFKPGQSGNPNGRTPGTRNKFGEEFIKQFAKHWAKNGEKVLDALVEEDRAMYARVAIAVLPKVIEFDDDTKDAIRNAGMGIPFAQIRQKAEETDSTKH